MTLTLDIVAFLLLLPKFIGNFVYSDYEIEPLGNMKFVKNAIKF